MFEGSEKKIELIFSEDSPSLFEKPLSFWKKIVRSCGAEIISYSKFPKIHSFILSESSLFLWKHRLVLITCGKTALSQSLIKILKSFPKDSIEVCFFQRKNEFFPQIQKSCFYKDLKKIKKRMPGKAYRFGSLHDHHFFLFHNDTDFMPEALDQTLEILIYDSDSLKNSSVSAISYLKQELRKAFYGFEIQDHFFKPLGYSLNAIRDSSYYTAHITPEKSFFYISFETNIKEKPISVLANKILNIFKPLRFDFVLFETRGEKKSNFQPENYFSSSSFYKVLDCGWNVSFESFHKIKTATRPPFPLNENLSLLTPMDKR